MNDHISSILTKKGFDTSKIDVKSLSERWEKLLILKGNLENANLNEADIYLSTQSKAGGKNE